MKNFAALALKLPALILGAMQIVERVKSAKGAEKKAAVLEVIDDSIELAEFGAGKDLLNDAVIIGLRDDYIAAEANVLNVQRIAQQAKQRLQAGILAKQQTAGQ